MANVYIGSGRVVKAEYKIFPGRENGLLEILVSVRSASRKKEGEQYDPSNMFKAVVWGKYATAISESKNMPEKGDKITFQGALGTPETYNDKDGILKIIQTIPSVDQIDIYKAGEVAEAKEEVKATAKAKAAAPKATSTAKKKSPVDKVEVPADFFELEEEEKKDDEFDDFEE